MYSTTLVLFLHFSTKITYLVAVKETRKLFLNVARELDVTHACSVGMKMEKYDFRPFVFAPLC